MSTLRCRSCGDSLGVEPVAYLYGLEPVCWSCRDTLYQLQERQRRRLWARFVNTPILPEVRLPPELALAALEHNARAARFFGLWPSTP